MSKHNTFRLFTVALGSKGMPVCSSCKKWSLLAGSCSVCASALRLVAAATGPRLPPTQEAQAKVTKILDSAFYSIGRLLPEDSPEKGESAPSEGQVEEEKKGDASSKKRSFKAKEEATDREGACNRERATSEAETYAEAAQITSYT